MSSWKVESGVRSMLQRPMPCGITRSMVSPALLVVERLGKDGIGI